MLSLLLCGVTGAVTVATGATACFLLGVVAILTPPLETEDWKQNPDVDVHVDVSAGGGTAAGADADADADVDVDMDVDAVVAAAPDSGDDTEPGDGSGDASEIGAAARLAISPPSAAMLTLLTLSPLVATELPEKPRPLEPVRPVLPPWKKTVPAMPLLLPLRRRRCLLSSISRSSSSLKTKLFPLLVIDRLFGFVEPAAVATEATLVLEVRGAWCLFLLTALERRGTGTTPTPTPSVASLAPVVSNTRFGQKSIQLSEVARCS